jgi:hypothetical protein
MSWSTSKWLGKVNVEAHTKESQCYRRPQNLQWDIRLHKNLELSWIVGFKSMCKVVELMHKVDIGDNKDYNVWNGEGGDHCQTTDC